MKKGISLSIGFILLLLLTACGGQKETASTKENSDAPKIKDVTIMLDWYPNAVHSFLYVAEEKGYFKEEGVNVQFQFPANPTDPINLAAAGKITLGISYQPDVVVARAEQNVPIKSVAAIVRSPLNHTVFLNDSSIKSPKDLEGKTVGYPGIPLNEALINTIVETDGGNPDKVKLTDVGFELDSSLISKKVDAVSGTFINHEVPMLSHKGYETRNFNPTEFGVPNYYELVAVTSDQTWKNEKDAIQAFWRAASKGFDFTKENPKEALEILMSNQDEANFPLVKEVETESLNILLPKMDTTEGFGSQSKESWQDTSEWMKKKGLIKEVANLEDIFININE